MFDGSIFNSARTPQRNITMKIGFLWAPTVEKARIRLYKYIPVKKKVTLIFRTETRTCSIEGYVESNDIQMFTQQEYADISIICPNPYFQKYSENPYDGVFEFNGIDPTFEFLRENGSSIGYIPNTTDYIIFGEYSQERYRTLEYEGDAETGFDMIIKASAQVTNPAIYSDSMNARVVISDTMLPNDEIRIRSTDRERSVVLIRDDQTINLINKITRPFKWFKLYPGSNGFAYDAESGADNLSVSIKYDTLYGGL